MAAGAFPILSLLLALPFAGAAGCLLLARGGARALAIAAAGATLLAALAAVGLFDPARGDFQLLEERLWIPGIGVHYRVGVDGLSLFFLPATALLFAAAIVAGARAPRPAPGFHYALLLLLEGATLGVFCALDTLLFFVFWEFALLPLYFLIGLWGLGAAGRAAAARYFLIMLAGGVPLLFALLLLAAASGLGFDLPALLALAPDALPRGVQLAVFLLLLIGLGVKVPFVPLHTWLPSLALGAPATVTALLVGLKLGAYGLLRLALPLSPLVARELHWLLAGLGTLAILYGAVAALAQSNLRGALAYGSVAHVGLAVLGLASFSVAGVQGTVLLLLGFALATGGSFLLLAALQRRLGGSDLARLSGLRRRMPRLAGLLLLFGLAGMGMPGTSGFPAEFLILVAALPAHSGAALAALFGLVVAAAAFLAPYRSAFFGPLRPGPADEADDLTRREFAVALLFALLLVGFGLWPSWLLEAIRPAAELWVARLS